MSLIKYEILNTVVEYGSLTKAAEALNITQSAVSHAIASLETECGFSLLHRGRSGVRVTAEGERILGYTREILRWTELMNQEISSFAARRLVRCVLAPSPVSPHNGCQAS